MPDLDVRPPDVVRYFCRVKPEVLARFAEDNGLRHLPARRVEDEFIYQNSFRLNQRYYASLGDKRAFVLCHGRDLLVFKIVGYAEQAAAYYRLREDLTAHVWIATNGTRPRAGCGILVGHIRSSASTRRWCTTATSPTITG